VKGVALESKTKQTKNKQKKKVKQNIFYYNCPPLAKDHETHSSHISVDQVGRLEFHFCPAVRKAPLLLPGMSLEVNGD